MIEAFDERMKLIRYRRKRESFRLREEIKIVPKGVIWTCVVLWHVAVAIGTLINLSGVNGETFPPDLAGHPAIASLALAGIITLVSVIITIWLMALGYVYRDARRRGMNGGVWKLLCMLLFLPVFAIGFILYLPVRAPPPVSRPRCSPIVCARLDVFP